MTLPKNAKYYAIGAAVLVVLIFFGAKACNIIDTSSVRIGELEAALSHAKAENATLAKERKENEKEIDILSGRIRAILAGIGKPTQGEKDKDKTIAGLKDEIEKYKKLGDCPSALASAEKAISEWSQKFSLAEDRHKADVFSLDREWQRKYDLQGEIGLGWKAEAENWKAAAGSAGKALSSVQWDLRKARLFSTVKSGLVIGLGAYVIYSIVKAK